MMAGIDPTTLLVGVIGVGCAVGLAVIAGFVSALMFLDASRAPEEEVERRSG